MQTERKQAICHRQENRDQVLEALINCSIRDKTFPDIPDVGIDRVMRHSSSMVQRLLTRIENIETQVIFWMICMIMTILISKKYTGGKGRCTWQVHCKYIARKWIKYPPKTHPVHCKHI